ncbi:MAG: S41 family peptidase [Sphaerochaetaceae bacterium]|nr:S41 family peptidase [Sphaerochaetaceae bacterium]
MNKFIKISIIFILSSSFLFANGSNEENTQTNIAPSTNTEIIQENMNNLAYLYQVVDALSINEIDNDKALEGMASGLLDSLGDEYSFYVSEEDAESYEEQSTGIYAGIGTYLTKKNPKVIDDKDTKENTDYYIKISSPFPGGPADRAGLKANDYITQIDGEPVDYLSATEASLKLRGEAGTDVVVTILRGSKSFDIKLTRELVETPSTTKAVIKNHIGYIQINQFTAITTEQFIEDFQSLLDQNIDSLIIDLRNNRGGIVDSALNIADLFLSGDTILITEQKETIPNNTQITKANTQTMVPNDFEVVLLVNGGTASSSEILTGALKDNDRALVIGSKTFGKGIMQQTFPFGKGFVQFTIAHYLTPDSIDIHEIGIEPDILIEEEVFEDDEIPIFEELMESNKIEEFVDNNPEYSYENIEKFADEIDNEELNRNALLVLVRNEYLVRMDYDDRPKYDLYLDKALVEAVEQLEK